MRTKNYSGQSIGVRGDINSVGLAGATVAVPFSVSAAQSNPAGLAMGMSSLSVQILKNTIHDAHLKNGETEYKSNQWGFAISPSPWGLGVLYDSPTSESGYFRSNQTGNDLPAEISVKVLRFVAARSFFDRQFSLGVSVGLARAVRDLGSRSYSATNASMQIGMMYQAPARFVFGLSYTPQNTIGPADQSIDSPDLPGFNRAIIIPHQLMFGVAWIPNRFLKLASALSFVAASPGTALLADESKAVGAYPTLQPRVGASYVVAEFENFKIECASGSYFETSRIQQAVSRLHGTFGLEVNPWFINSGFGFDLAADYKNVMVSIGVDVVRFARVLDLIPRSSAVHANQFLPVPFNVSDEGVPASLQIKQSKHKQGESVTDVVKIISNVPDQVLKKFQSK